MKKNGKSFCDNLRASSTFQPKINRNAARISNRGLPDQSVTDLLYRDAHERKIKEKEYQKSVTLLQPVAYYARLKRVLESQSIQLRWIINL
jgi:hypothetical protein